MSLGKSVLVLFLLFLLATTVSLAGAQDTGPTSNVTYFVVVCADSGVVNFSGTMQAGYDLYYQVFANSQGTGGAITALRQVSVDGAYEFSETISYNPGATVPVGHVSSFYIAIARESDPSATIYSDYVDDIQDGCAVPQFQPNTSTPTGDTETADETEGEDTTGEAAPVDCTPPDPATLPYILSPFGGYLNANYVPQQGPPCNTAPWTKPRQETAGLIFAECNQYPMAEPGIIYDIDNITLFWSWYARTRQQVLDHMEHVTYSVTFYNNHQVPVPFVDESDIQYINGNYWIFYTVPFGNLRPGHYGIAFYTLWDEPISDGYDEYGPGTDYELLHGSCDFDILPNEEGLDIPHFNWPPYYP